jgi:PKD repeat protein
MRKLPASIVGLLIIAVAAAACVESPPPLNKAPVARIGSPVNQATFDTGVIITFDGSGSYDPEKKALTYAWAFGDGQNGTGNRTTHSYSLPGKYIVSLEVSDGKKKGTDRAELHITQANRAPAVQFTAGNTTVSNEETVAFNASGTTDADNDTLVFNWAFGDGATASGKVVSHLYAAVGAYNVTLNVSDGKTTATLMRTMTVYQANRAPVPALKATPLAAFMNSPVLFDASGSTDADNDTLSASWDFGDGGNATGLKTEHTYARVGNFTVTGTVRDGKAERSASLIITVLPRAKILVDWNQTDYGYIIEPEAAVGEQNLSVEVVSTEGGADPSAELEPLSGGRFRATSTVVPVRGATLTVTARYWGLVIGSRTMTVYENTPMPGRNCTVTFDAAMNSHTFTNGSDTWFNVSGDITVVVRDFVGEYSLRLTDGTMENSETTENGDVRIGKMELVGGWFNQTLDAGMQTATRMEMVMTGNTTTTNDTGAEVEKLRIFQEMVKVDRETTQASITMEGTQMGSNLKVTIETLGLEEYANGAGKRFPCIKLRLNYSVDAYMPNPPGEPLHMKYFREETQWNVQDEDRYTNTTIYSEWAMNVFLVNDTSGEWTLAQNDSGSGYTDSNGDGTYNPDEKPLSSDEAFTFHGLVVRELVVGDRITGTNEHGVTVAIEVLEGGTRTVDGTAYEVVLMRGTYSGADGKADGTSENWIISEGNLTGLTLESKEQKHWAGEAGTEDGLSTFKAVSIEEE